MLSREKCLPLLLNVLKLYAVSFGGATTKIFSRQDLADHLMSAMRVFLKNMIYNLNFVVIKTLAPEFPDVAFQIRFKLRCDK